jgi:hypothetical protein
LTVASRGGTSLAGWLGVLAAIGVLVVVLAWQRGPVAPPGGELARSGAGVAASSGRTLTGPAAQRAPTSDDVGRTPPEQALGAVDPRAAWREQVARAVQPVVVERLGRQPTAVEEERLVDALASVGPAARTLDRETLDPDDPRSIARVREDTRILVEADQHVRELLGIGIAELLRRLDPSRIDDQGRDAAG